MHEESKAGEMLSPDERDASEREEKLQALGLSLSRKRKEAIEGRRNCGIEDEWRSCQDAYDGIDDANRGDERVTRTRPFNGAMPAKQDGVRSTVFLNITQPFTDIAAARIGDILLPTDDRNWSLRPTPIPSLTKLLESEPPVMASSAPQVPAPGTTPQAIPGTQGGAAMGPAMGQQAMGPAIGQPPGPAMGMIPGPKNPFAEEARRVMDSANEKARAAEKRIEDWLVESQWHSHVRQVIDDAARLGSGVLKGPYPSTKQHMAFMQEAGGMQIVMASEITPSSKAIKPYNLYPDPSCGESIHDGDYIWERDEINRRGLRKLKEEDGYLADQIDFCLEEGPQSPEVLPDDFGVIQKNDKESQPFEVWYFYGHLDRDDMEAAGCKCPEGEDVHVPALVTMVNHRVVKAALNPDDSGEFPYDLMPWKKKDNMPWGSGVPKEMDTAQRILNGATRHLMSNAALSAGVQIILRQGVVTPADGNYVLTPNKVWYANKDADLQRVGDAFVSVVIPSMQRELMEIIHFAMNMAERVTGLPLILQGQLGKSSPDTFQGQQLAVNNASGFMRRVAKLFDDHVTEPHIGRYYRYLMLYGEKDEEKGDFTVDARGSSALVERDLQNHALVPLLQAAMNPAYGVDPKKTMQEWLSSQHLDRKRFEFDDEEWRKVVAGMTQKTDPKIEVEKVRAEVAAVKLRAQAEQAEKDRMLDMWVQTQENQIKAMELAGQQTISLEKVKAMLADTAISQRNKRELFAAEQALKLATGSGI